mmetsp:Transcript_14108/g.29685  ORF Transcript_14108/g.29685 Transcript_14108/m.29685 type:complete len:357 (-) Transcript_14108:1006-2076(-)|eukprot:CAMPEP_0171353554 /NCGR_PEP_ID=MMETSP0878-20121228/44249_1 /TAXON_ID=67004 /ORGANISM="Thalassiosira weissflogii, Strain CCMP1336" /LENGTH=356 /DNA_ID=CAMNT_0011859501 /DNA_START=203 /DNA_END=1273 /DNA_ORIENTATION=-
MKYFFTSTVIAAVLSSKSCAAFTPTKPMVSPIQGTYAAKMSKQGLQLRSTVIKEADVTTEKQTTEEESSINYSFQESENIKKSYLDDGFIFGLDGSGLERPKGKVASVVVEGDSLETTPQQVGIVSATFAGHAFFSASSILNLLSQHDGDIGATALTSLSVIIASWILADFGSGVFHWSVDNYGNGKTPIMGNIIAAFQGHHSAPWTITYRGFCNNVWKLCIPFGIPTIAAINVIAGPENPMITLFFAVFCAIEIMSQELHKWSHMTKSETPFWVNTLQDLGISIGRVPHAKHHIAPYDGNYCIVSGLCNEALDKSGFFRWMEHRIYDWNGVESNAWKLDPELRARTLRGDYSLPL